MGDPRTKALLEGVSERQARRLHARLDVLGIDNMVALAATSLASGDEQDALIALAQSVRDDLVRRALAGEIVSAKAARLDALTAQPSIDGKGLSAFKKAFLKLDIRDRATALRWVQQEVISENVSREVHKRSGYATCLDFEYDDDGPAAHEFAAAGFGFDAD
jgi:hypothetical protein